MFFAGAVALGVGIIAAVVFIASPVPSLRAAGTTYYVSLSSGNDSNTGTSQTAPWRTAGKVNATTFQPGDQILFKSGDTWFSDPLIVPSSGTANAPLLFGAYGTGSKPKFDGQGGTFANGLINITAKNYGTIDGFEATNGACDLVNVNPGTSSTSAGVIVRNCDVHHDTEPGYSLLNVLNYIPGGTVSRTQGSLTNVLVENNTVHDSQWNGIRLNSGVNFSTIQGNTIYDILAHGGIDVKDGANSGSYNDHINILNNEVYNAETGIFFTDASNGLVDGNKVHNTGNVSTFKAGITFQRWNTAVFTSLNNNTFRRNIVYNNAWVGIWIVDTVNPVVYNNTLYNNGTSGSGGSVFSQNNTNFVQCNTVAYTTGGHNVLNALRCGSQPEYVSYTPLSRMPRQEIFACARA
jgi:parallel beta-helix repeat protein